jgi:CRISPR-associated protein Cas1
MSEDIQVVPRDGDDAALRDRNRTTCQASRLAASIQPREDVRPQGPAPENPSRDPVFERALEILRKEFPPPGREAKQPSPKLRLAPATLPAAGSQPPPELAPETSARGGPPPAVIPARMLNEFVYCPRLFYYEFVESVFVESADTLRGKALHRRVDSGKGDLPPPGEKEEGRRKKAEDGGQDSLALGAAPATADPEPATDEVIHSRSVQMGSGRLGVTAKMDLVEVRAGMVPGEPGESGDLLSALEVCPVDYKAGAPRVGEGGIELWDADRMQLGVQALVLRDNGYTCNEGVIYYRETKQRVRLPIMPELVLWVEERIAAARQAATAAIPPPLVASPKCPRCSLVTVCLPDETRLLANPPVAADVRRLTSPAEQPQSTGPNDQSLLTSAATVRRLIAARDDSRALYLSTQGLRVGRKDEVLQIKQEKALVEEVRINDVSHVALFGNIQITTQTIQTLCELEVPVTYFSMGGWFYGLTRGHELKNVFLRIEQFRLARDPATCLRLARQFVQGKIRNHRTMLMRNHVEAPPATLLKLKQYAEAATRAESIESLLGVEGGAAAAYFGELSGMIKPADELDDQLPGLEVPTQQVFNFNFHGRNRRPPTDPVNALLSLAYSLLAKDCLLAALAVGFDPYVGFYHQPRFGRPALALDLMEEFRPLVAESAVLTCINNRVVSESDFVQAGQAVNLTAAGRKRFFQTYEQRMSALLTHPVFDYKVSYRRALELQARLLAKVLTGEIPEYVPLTTR